MTTMKKVNELTGAALDYWVAKAVGMESVRVEIDRNTFREVPFSPSTDWKDGGPIIERERIAVVSFDGCWGAFFNGSESYIDVCMGEADGAGPTPLIAAMRAFVASKFGDTVSMFRPEDFGAKGDGVTNDTAAFNAAADILRRSEFTSNAATSITSFDEFADNTYASFALGCCGEPIFIKNGKVAANKLRCRCGNTEFAITVREASS